MKFKGQSDIRDYILSEFIFNKEYVDMRTYFSNLDLLVENFKGTKICFNHDLYLPPDKYQVACKFAIEYDKSLKDQLRKTMLEDEYRNSPMITNADNRIKELCKYCLLDGTYYIQLSKKHDDFLVLSIASDEENEFNIKCMMYFIGDRWAKYRDEFLAEYSKYAEITASNKSDKLCYDDFEGYKETVYKSFDYMVFKGKEELIQYIDNFFNNIPAYASYEMIPKLSILLYGNPGTGKSTLAKAIAKYLNMHLIRIMTPGYFTQDDDGNDDRRRPNRMTTKWLGEYINVIDDIDCICTSRDEDKSPENLAATSSLLEFLDNPGTMYYKAKDGNYYQIAIVVASTNYYERLDKAVVRTGRFDFQLEMSDFDRELAEKFCNLYNLKLKDVISDKIDDNFTIQPSTLQALCLKNIDKSLKEVK